MEKLSIAKSSKVSDPGNYRPISLTCILCKLLEKYIICLLMREQLFNSHPLSNYQWGFHTNRSTVSALLSITHEWLSTLDCGNEISAVFFDYQKAFGSVPHQPLIKKLENLNFNRFIIQWITDYLTNHFQRVVVNGTSSQPSPVFSGVPQGSVLGPLLFIIYVNDLLELELFTGAKIHLYADDILLYHTVNSADDFNTLQIDIDKIVAWSNAHYTSANT